MRKDIQNHINRFTREERCLLNKSEMARRFNCDPRTIHRYLEIESGELVQKPSNRTYISKLDDYKEIIIDKVDKYGATAMAAYTFIQKKGYTGKYSTVAAFVKKHKKNQIHKATIRFETGPGLQAQVDWKEEVTMISRYAEVFKINIFLMVLGYSRLKYICVTTNRNQNTLFSCMSKAFDYFQGIPHEILFDNMKTVVDHSKSTFTKTVINSTFKHFADDATFKTMRNTGDGTFCFV
ncbi:IS21 family transposase [Alkalibaculum sporogenes]|nr:IS21 family transposase [Alkalibaculum sporogenes]